MQTGGAEKSILEIASRLKDFEVTVVLLFSDKDDLRKDYEYAGLNVIDLHISRYDKLWFWNGKKRFEKVVEKIQPNIVHAHLFKSEFIARIVKLPKQTKLVGAFVNDSYARERYLSQSFVRNFKLNTIKFFDKITINKNHYITSITEAIKKTNCEALGYPQSNTIVINRGREIENDQNEYKYYEKKEAFNFIAVGRLLKRKGYIELINAVAILNEKGYNFKLNIAGTGVDEGEIKKYAFDKKLKNIHFLGHRTDVPHLLATHNCFVFVSHYEGQGGSLVEAMLAGIPIITTDIDVFKEQVEDGFSAQMAKVKNPESIARQMEWMIQNYGKAIEMGKNARNVAEQRFDIENIAKETESFYKQIVKE